MASLRKQATSKYWFACLIDKNGKRIQKSTKLTNRKQAQKVADELESIYRNEVSARKYLELIKEAHKSATGQDDKAITYSKYAQLFLKAKQPEVKPATYDFYQTSAREFGKWLGERIDKDLNSISKDDLVDYRHELSKRLSPKTVNHNLVFVKHFFKHAKMEGHIHENPAENLMRVKIQMGESIRRPFTNEELQVLLAVAEPEWKSMILFGLYTGQRLGDIAKYKWSNIDLNTGKEGVIRLTATKTGKKLEIPIHPTLREHIDQLPNGDPRHPLHPECQAAIQRKNENQGRGECGSLSSKFARILAKAELRPRYKRVKGDARKTRRQTNELSFHCLRHTAASKLVEAGAPPAVIMDLIGWSNADVMALYTHLSLEGKEKAMDLMATH